MNILFRHPGIEQLPAIGFDQVEKNLNGKIAVPGGARREKQHGIFFAHGVRLFDLVEERPGVGELGFEVLAHFFTDRIAAVVNAGTDCSFEIARVATEVAVHLAHTLFDDALHRASPSGVEDANRALPAIDHDDRKAVGGLDGKQESRCAGEKAVADERFGRRAGDRVNDVGVDLAERCERPGMPAAGTKFAEERGAISLHVGSAVCFGEAEIERLAAVDARVAALPGRKSMNQPRAFLKMRGLEDGELRVCRDPGWHGTILA